MNEYREVIRSAVQGMAAQLTEYGSNHPLFDEGGPSDGVFLVHDGYVRIFTSDTWGRESLVRFACPGDLIGEISAIDAEPRTASARTDSQVWAYSVSHQRFLTALTEDHALALALLRHCAESVRATTAQVNALASNGRDARVARILLEVLRRYDNPEAKIGATHANHQRLASMAGLGRQATTKCLGELRAAGIIDYRPRGPISILCRDELERLAGMRL